MNTAALEKLKLGKEENAGTRHFVSFKTQIQTLNFRSIYCLYMGSNWTDPKLCHLV